MPGSRLCLYEDGTEVTESYFHALPPQTELVLLGPGETWRGCESGGGPVCVCVLGGGDNRRRCGAVPGPGRGP